MKNTNYKGTLQKTHRLAKNEDFIYNIAIHGYGALSKEQRLKLTPDQNRTIRKIYGKSQDLINTYKNEIVIEKTNSWLIKLFPNMDLVKDLISSDCDTTSFNKLTFKDLGITKQDIFTLLTKHQIFQKYDLQFN